MYEYIFVDMDGTLMDTGEGVTNSVAYALERFGIDIADRNELYKFIGPPLTESFREYCGFDEAKTNEAIAVYREYYTDKGLFECYVYDGMREALDDMNKAGKKVVLATSKPEDFAKKILEKFDLDKYFYFVAGASMDGVRNSKSDVLRYAIEECKITDMTQILMVGDRKYDMLGAAEFDIDGLGVLFGYGDEEELRQAGAKYIVQSAHEIINYI